MKNVFVYYENFEDKDQWVVEEENLEYMDKFIKVLIKLSSMIPKSLCDILDARAHSQYRR